MTVDEATPPPLTGPAPETPADPAKDGGDSIATIVEMSIFGQSVRVESREPLHDVAAAAVDLWERLGQEPRRTPIGTAGFLTAEPSMHPVDDLHPARGINPDYGHLGDVR